MTISIPEGSGSRCQSEGCGQRYHDACHVKRSPAFKHVYMRKKAHARVIRLCKSCEDGKHERVKTRNFGCIEHVTPESYVCGCRVCADASKHSREGLWRVDSDQSADE